MFESSIQHTISPFTVVPKQSEGVTLQHPYSNSNSCENVSLIEATDTENRVSTRTASALHRFNRYEIKYLLDEANLDDLRERLKSRMLPDAYQSSAGASLVTSLYYDSKDLRCYWEKIEGLRFRRKLRIRVYGDPENVTDDTIVFVEIKQRVNRVTQKRRIPLKYSDARILCDQRLDPENSDAQPEFVNEVLNFSQTLDLQPTAITSYHREAFVGVDADTGVRVTLDHRVRGRNRDFYLGAAAENQFIIPPHLAVIELKANERVPQWFTDLAAEINLNTVRISKYCQSVESHELGVRATQHAREFPEPLNPLKE